MRRVAKPSKARVESKLPVARKSRQNEGSRVRDLEQRLAEALEQQTATSEILSVISSSPTDVQPVFDTIARNARRFCEADSCSVFTYRGDLIRLESIDNATVEGADAIRRAYPLPASRGHATGRAILTGRPVHIADVRHDPEYDLRGILGAGLRTIVAVPMLRDGSAIGTITLHTWETPRPFSATQVALIQTFADQAVIALENVRLFTELQEKNRALTAAHAQTSEALEQQTATSEILRVISSSPTGIQPIFEAIVRFATTLCEADLSGLYPFDGDLIHFGAQHGRTPDEIAAAQRAFPQPPSRLSVTARAILAATVVQVADVSEDPEVADPLRLYRTVLSVPMIRDDRPIGAITVARRSVRPFTDKQIALLQTFADQAVIAIENVRLFKELQTRNQELTVALAQQTATSEVLAVISGAQTDAQPVFEAIVQSARRLCDASYSSVYRVDGQLVHLVAHNHQTPEAAEAIRGAWPMPLTGDSFVVRAIHENAVIHTDMQEDPTASAALIARGKALGHRRIVVVPMVREGQPIGAIRVSRGEATPFAGQHIALLQTFADQAVIAIENVRLFRELEARNRDLTEALEQRTATADVLRIIAQSPTELQPVLDAIAASAVRLCEANDAVIERLEGDRFYNAAHAGAQMKGLVRLPLPLTRRFPGGRAVLDRQRVILDDIHLVAEQEYPDTLELLKLNTIHSVAEIPLLSEGKPLGSLAVLRAEVRPFRGDCSAGDLRRPGGDRHRECAAVQGAGGA